MADSVESFDVAELNVPSQPSVAVPEDVFAQTLMLLLELPGRVAHGVVAELMPLAPHLLRRSG